MASAATAPVQLLMYRFGADAGGIVAPLLGFRMDARERTSATERALGRGGDWLSGERDVLHSAERG